jgi:hypothetical protein
MMAEEVSQFCAGAKNDEATPLLPEFATATVPALSSRLRRSRRQLLLFAAVLVPGLIFLAKVPPVEGSLYPKCLFHLATGWHCAGCGMARALHACLNGQFLQAVAYNPLAVAALPFLLVWGVRQLLARWSGREISARRLPATVIGALFCLIILYTVLRNIPLPPFDLLAPHELANLTQ